MKFFSPIFNNDHREKAKWKKCTEAITSTELIPPHRTNKSNKKRNFPSNQKAEPVKQKFFAEGTNWTTVYDILHSRAEQKRIKGLHLVLAYHDATKNQNRRNV